MEQFYDKFSKECMDKPILNHYDPYQMFQRITCANNEDIVLIKEMLINRAKKHKDELEPEVEFIKKLKKQNTKVIICNIKKQPRRILHHVLLQESVNWKTLSVASDFQNAVKIARRYIRQMKS
jgi:hypothetical protein